MRRIALLLFLAIHSGLAIGQSIFSEWQDYEYFWIKYRSNTWTSTASIIAVEMTYDNWNHVNQTKEFLAKKVGRDKILPEKKYDWPKAALENEHRVLFINVWSDGIYQLNMTGQPYGRSFTTWKYFDLTDVHRHNLNPQYNGCRAEERFDHATKMSVKRDHIRIQDKWESAHSTNSFTYNPASEEYILLQLEELNYFDTETTQASNSGLNAEDVKRRVDDSNGDCIYGMYRLAPGASSTCDRFRLGVIDWNDQPSAIVTESSTTSDGETWTTGEVIARFTRTASPSIYICDWMQGESSYSEGFAECNGAMMTISFPALEGTNRPSCDYIKTYPLNHTNDKTTAGSGQAGPDNAIGSGSAVVIDGPNQFIITNHHVVDAGQSFAVEINGDLYEATLVNTDTRNDLALLKIEGSDLSLNSIPISMDDQLGDRVYSAGYPKVFEMGKDIKVTEGVISSMSFLSDPSMYQTSVPITNGNSGGALLDKNGNLAGITQGGWRPDANTENVNSAVKSLYVIGLSQTEPNCTPSLEQKTTPIDFSGIQHSVLPLFVYD